MSVFLWKADWETGHARIDSQHKELLQQMNDLFDALKHQDGADLLPGVLDFLTTYVEIHFQDEERAMEATHYPGLASHRAIHDGMRKSVGDLLTQFQEGRTLVTPGLVEYLVDWLMNHIEGEDYFMAVHLKRYEVGQRNLDAVSA